jgi:hypothetical protein
MSGINALTDVSARVNLPNLYIFDCAGVGGYAIVAADNRVKPIMDYSLQVNFPQPVPSVMQSRLAGYDRIVADAVRNNVTPSPEVRDQWRELLHNGSKDEEFGWPLYTNLYGDCAPFNVYCPFDRSGEQYHCKVGSLAVAVASLILFYQQWDYNQTTGGNYPYAYPFFHGTKTYTDPTYGTLSADFSGHAAGYAASSGSNFFYYARTSPSPMYFSFDLVAEFLAEVAVAIHTKFGPYRSSANLDSALAALAYHFGYDTSTSADNVEGDNTTTTDVMHIYTRGDWTGTGTLNLRNTLKDEINAFHPILCQAVNRNNTADTHYFLIDAYYTDRNNITRFHLNWGDQGDSVTSYCGDTSTYTSITTDGMINYANGNWKLERIICNLKPKQGWFHTDKDVVDIPWSGSTYDDYPCIRLYSSNSTPCTTQSDNSNYCIGEFYRYGQASGSTFCTYNAVGSNYQNAYDISFDVGASTAMGMESPSWQCYFLDNNGDTAKFTYRHAYQFPYDTIIHDNGEFDHAVSNQSSTRQKWAIRIPKSELAGFEGYIRPFRALMVYLPSPGIYDLKVYYTSTATETPQQSATPVASCNISRCTTAGGCGWHTITDLAGSTITPNSYRIDTMNYLWFTIEAQGIDSSTVGNWAAVSSHPGTGDYWYVDQNNTWQQMSSDYSWMIRPIFLNNNCTRPTDFQSWVVEGGTAILVWNGLSDGSFELEWGPHNFAHGDSTSSIIHNLQNLAFTFSDDNGTSSTTTTYEFVMPDSLLNPHSSYDFYIRSACGAWRSPWVGPVNVETRCDIPYQLPFYEDFMEGFPQCWEEESMSGILEWLMNSGYWRSYMRLPGSLFPINPQPQPSDNILPTSGAPADSAMLISPMIDISTTSGIVAPMLTFVQRQTSYVSTDTNVINIYYRNNVNTSSWTLLMRDSIYSYDIDTVMIRLPNPSEYYQLAFEISTDGVLGAVFGAVAVTDSVPRNITKSIVPANSGTVTGDGYYLLGDMATLVANPATGYHFHYWVIQMPSIGSSDTIYSNPLNFTVTASANCEAHFWHEGGINNANTHRSIAVYPNPTNGRLTLDADDVRSVEVLDMMGRTVYTAKRTNQLDIQTLPNGAYLLRITLPDDVCVTKINKQ